METLNPGLRRGTGRRRSSVFLQEQQQELVVVPRIPGECTLCCWRSRITWKWNFGSAGSEKCPRKSRAVIRRHNGKVVPSRADSRWW